MPFSYNCECCGNEITRPQRNRRAHIFCSPECYHAATRKVAPIMCEQCGKEFLPSNGSSRYSRRFCSIECYKSSVASEMVDKICPVCGLSFSVRKCVADRYTVCSRACRTASTKYEPCKRCGKVFRANKDFDRHYCSEECRRPPHFMECKYCGETFRVSPAAERVHCSFRCYRLSQGETLLESKVRLSLGRLGIPFVQEQPVGQWLVDFAIPELKVGIEVDGVYWHRDPIKDRERDKKLARYGWTIIHLLESDISNCVSLDMFIRDHLAPYLELINWE